MDRVYVCYISEDIKYNNQGQIIGVFEDASMACQERDRFNEKYSYMIADVIDQEIVKSI